MGIPDRRRKGAAYNYGIHRVSQPREDVLEGSRKVCQGKEQPRPDWFSIELHTGRRGSDPFGQRRAKQLVQLIQ